MIKEFEEWNVLKKNIDTIHASALFYKRELWWCSIGTNIGHEENGKGNKFARPVIIFRVLNTETFWGIPVTTKIKNGKYNVSINIDDMISRQAKISQLRLFDTRRLISKIGMISICDYWFIRKAITDISNL